MQTNSARTSFFYFTKEMPILNSGYLHTTSRSLRLFFAVLPALCCPYIARAQQDPAFVHYWALETQFNPAAVGQQDQLAINGAVQMHATGFKDAGSTVLAAADAAFMIGKTRHGVGAVFQKDEIGLFSHQLFALQYAYKFKILGGYFGIGVEADMLAEKINGSKVDLGDAGDPAFPTQDLSGSRFDLSAGLHYQHKNWHVGDSALLLSAATVELGETNEYKVKMRFNLNGGYNIRLKNPFFMVAPTVMLRYDGTDFRADITARMEYEREKKRFYGGLSYSPQHSVAVFLGGTLYGVNIGYSYEAFTSGIGIQSGNHELTLGYRLDLDFSKRGKNLHKSVRYL